MARYVDIEPYKDKVIASHKFSGVYKLIEVNQIPTADVKPVIHAEWVLDDEHDYCCSECGQYSPCKYSYCYHCSAKMDLQKINKEADKAERSDR